MLRFRLSLMVLAACGGDDAMTMVDASVNTVEHDLSCLQNNPTPPASLQLDSVLLDTTNTNPFPVLADAPFEVWSLDGTTMLASATSDAEGNFSVEVPTGGQLTRFRYVVPKIGTSSFMRILMFASLAPWRSTIAPDRTYFFAAKPSRRTALGVALGTQLDPTKGSFEAWLVDCGGQDFPGETLTIAEAPDTQWAMFGGTGVWIPRSTTLKGAGQSESVAGTVNLEPGPKSITWTAGDRTLGPVTFDVEANAHTIVVLVPGYPTP